MVAGSLRERDLLSYFSVWEEMKKFVVLGPLVGSDTPYLIWRPVIYKHRWRQFVCSARRLCFMPPSPLLSISLHTRAGLSKIPAA